MGKSSSQVVGYRYYAKFAAFIGNRIEKLIGINFDNRKWVIHDPLKHPPNLLPVLENNLFGENEGGVSGQIDIHFGYPDQEPNSTYQKHFPLVSGYPYQSYLVFRGLGGVKTDGGLIGGVIGSLQAHRHDSFYLGNSGYMKEMLLWVKRTRVRNDGRGQWYASTEARPWVCEVPQTIFFQTESDYIDSPRYVSTKVNSFGSNEQGVYNDTAYYNPDRKNTVSTSFAGMFVIGGSYDDRNLKVTISFDLSGITGLHEVKASFLVRGESVITSNLGNWLIFNVSEVKNNETAVRKISVSGVIEAGSVVGITTQCLKPDLSQNNVYGVSYECLSFSLYRTDGNFKDDTETPDINPIHKIREILTDDTAMAKPEIDVNDINFMKAADRIWDEGLGVSWAIDEKSCIDAIEELCYHIEAGIRVNRQTGLYEMVLFRDDWFAENEIHTIAENKIKDLSLEVMNSDDIVNQLNVTYYDRKRIKNSTFSVYENGSILTMGKANAESIEFPYFMNMRNAEVVANWKLKQFSTPAWSGSFSTGWKEARKWNRYDLIRLPWSSKWNGTILARIMKINLGNGTDNTVTIDFEEVIPYSGEMNTSIVVDALVESAPQPPQPSINAVFEAPHYLTVLRAGQINVDLELSNNPDIGYVAAIAAKPQNNSLNALLFTDGGMGEFEQVSRLDYCDILQLDQSIIETTSSFTVAGSLTQVANSNNLILLNDELMGFVSFDNETKVLTVKRGVLDTVPKKHSGGSLFVFDLPDVAFDSTQYSQSEIVEAQVLTTTPSGIQELSGNSRAIEIRSRAIRPYPPANVKINDAYYPETIIVTNDIVLTWVDRNRLQQTGGTPLGFFDGGVTVEQGVNYSYELASEDVVLDSASAITGNTATILSSVLIPNKPHTLKLWSVRDGYDSYQVFEHSFFAESVSLVLTASTDGSSVTGNTVPVANISVNVDESLSANMKFDGSAISGKAEAGATITIEIQE
ncbi:MULTISPECIES: hypothetical protein [unclassified Acinetobacter]|uniref:hypothetical protein n=1 Tax=unclassified Acinetobacter TaxID=196816 RepID=UPI0015D2564F|nr:MULTISPECIES: hypothetical protein [unclassified Acinetobacter]